VHAPIELQFLYQLGEMPKGLASMARGQKQDNSCGVILFGGVSIARMVSLQLGDRDVAAGMRHVIHASVRFWCCCWADTVEGAARMTIKADTVKVKKCILGCVC
jgi:hypothetical protein